MSGRETVISDGPKSPIVESTCSDASTFCRANVNDASDELPWSLFFLFMLINFQRTEKKWYKVELINFP